MAELKSIQKVVDRVFTESEIILLQMLADGSKREDIAAVIDRSVRTVESKIDSLRDEFKCKTVPQLIAFGFRNNLIS